MGLGVAEGVEVDVNADDLVPVDVTVDGGVTLGVPVDVRTMGVIVSVAVGEKVPVMLVLVAVGVGEASEDVAVCVGVFVGVIAAEVWDGERRIEALAVSGPVRTTVQASEMPRNTRNSVDTGLNPEEKQFNRTK